MTGAQGIAGGAPASTPAARVGHGQAPCHHGELLQGVFDCDGTLHRALVTLPCPLFVSRARLMLRSGPLTVSPTWKIKACVAVRLAFTELGLRGFGGRLELAGGAPVGHGFGSSTSDVVAAIRAAFDVVGRTPALETLARLAVEAEQASDALMFARPVLFAQREGRVLEHLGAALPPLEVLGFFSASDEQGVDTLAFPPARYEPDEIAALERLRGQLREAVVCQDVAGIGAVATASARLNQRHLPVAALEDLVGVAVATGATGVHVAHTGDIAGLIYAQGTGDAAVERGRGLLSALGIARKWRFAVGHRTAAAP